MFEGVNAEGIPLGESMTIMYRGSTNLQCRGHFATLSTPFASASCIETIFEIGFSFFARSMFHFPRPTGTFRHPKFARNGRRQSQR